MVFYIRKEKIEMHKQFDQVVALCIAKNFVQAICTCACTCALVQYIEENDRNAATIWSMGVCCQFKAGLASPQPFLFTHSPLTVNGDHIKDEEEEEKTPIAMTIYCSDNDDDDDDDYNDDTAADKDSGPWWYTATPDSLRDSNFFLCPRANSFAIPLA